MNPGDLALLIACGGLGAGARYVIDVAVMRGRAGAFPAGILIVNVSGSLLLGLLTGLGAALSATWLVILGIGLCGGYTTFSTVSVDTALLAERGKRSWAWLNLLGTFSLAVAAAGIGFAVGGLF